MYFRLRKKLKQIKQIKKCHIQLNSKIFKKEKKNTYINILAIIYLLKNKDLFFIYIMDR